MPSSASPGTLAPGGRVYSNIILHDDGIVELVTRTKTQMASQQPTQCMAASGRQTTAGVMIPQMTTLTQALAE